MTIMEAIDNNIKCCANCGKMRTKTIRYKGRQRLMARCSINMISRGVKEGWFIERPGGYTEKLPKMWMATCQHYDDMRR
ncbi:MAG: hypothetical protein D6726_07910 [Nitrospirae bacterium]|nr:MAG: hypothetical protein D6726_07910 [Nitrospirota bacterium]